MRGSDRIGDEHDREVTMVWEGKGWRRLCSTTDACPYVHCQAPHERVGRISNRIPSVDLYRCTGPEEHGWAEPAENLAE